MSTMSGQTAVITSPAVSTTSATVLTERGTRNMWFVFNATAAILYLRFGTAPASSTDYSVQVPAGGYYECPVPVYGGRVTGILASGSGNVQVTAW